ncbi:MAG: SPOR domain-containing protein [Candidatus Omnitrophica bacterium]|nr:SPOR domain-containing protein [Candidatus Omnitrophota bacterium]MCM8798165.1 SPOR domain-containing protein [Candidatus Omnitrophota bacterium]
MRREIQIDLFSEESQKVRRNYYPSFKKLFPYGFVNIRLSYEGMVFSFIVFMLLGVIIFSLGVERGKHLKFLNDHKTLPLESSSGKAVYKPYTIQIASYRDKKMAVKLIRELIQDGYKPFVIQNQSIYQVCVGKYSNQEIAREVLYDLIKKYRTSYIRTIP